MKKHIQTDSEWQEEMSQKIIDEIQCELYLDMPFMKLALSALSPKVNGQLYSMATDGTVCCTVCFFTCGLKVRGMNSCGIQHVI